MKIAELCSRSVRECRAPTAGLETPRGAPSSCRRFWTSVSREECSAENGVENVEGRMEIVECSEWGVENGERSLRRMESGVESGAGYGA